MTLKTERSLLWAKIVLGLILIACFMPALTEMFAVQNRQETVREKHLPTFATVDQYVAYLRKMAAEVDEPATTLAREHQVLADISGYQETINKFIRSRVAQGPIEAHARILTEMVDIRTIHDRYIAKFGKETVDRYLAEHPADPQILTDRMFPSVPDRTWPLFLSGYMTSVFTAMLFYLVCFWQMGVSGIVELPRIIAFALVWPIQIWRYPSELNVIESVRRLLRYAAYFLSVALSLGASGAAFAKASNERKPKGEESSDPIVRTIDTVPMIELPKLSAVIGVMSGKAPPTINVVHTGMVSTAEITATWDTGWSVDLWTSRAVNGDLGSDEIDLTVWKSGQVGDFIYTAGTAWFDLKPMSSTAGDMLAPFIAFDRKIGSWTATARVDGYVMMGGSPNYNGWSVGLSMNRTFALPHDFSLSVGGTLGISDGPFEAKSGATAQANVSLSRKISDRSSMTFWGKAFAGIVDARDRHPGTIVGVSLSYAP